MDSTRLVSEMVVRGGQAAVVWAGSKLLLEVSSVCGSKEERHATQRAQTLAPTSNQCVDYGAE